jgi:uncharacterized protein YndB with AHSA1/START domain
MRLVHRVHTSASPAEVWALLGDPTAWSQFDVFLRGVRRGHGPVAAGQTLMARLRLSVGAVPVDVLEAEPERRLVLVRHLVPGLREQVTYELTPAVRGGCDIAVSVVVDGVFALPAVLGLWLADGLTVRVLAARTDATARRARRTAA